MYSLKHGVNLSRRACRACFFVFCIGCVLDVGASPFDYSKGHLDSNGYDLGSLANGVPTKNYPLGSQVNNEVPTDSSGTHSGGSGETTPKKKEVERIQVISVSFHRVETPFIIGLWIFCASLAKIGFHMAPKLSVMVPESCLLIVVGVLIGFVLVHITDSVHMSPLTPEAFFFYMLPPIILDAGYFMPNRLFFDHLGTILLFAVIGTIFNTLLIGASLWAVGLTGVYSCDTPLLDMFLFGSLISAVDPVAVLAVFEEIQVNEILYIVVFGESLLNDAVTVVLYHLFESYKEMGLENIIYTDALAGLMNFFVVAIGGTVIGVIWGFATALVTRYTNEVRVIEPIFIFVMAYMAYMCAEIFHMSGILAITFCGITMKNYVEANVSHKSHTTIKYAMKMLSSSSETIIFMFLGVATVHRNHDWNIIFIFLTIFFCSAYRVLGVIILTAIANRFRLHQLNKVEKFVMSYGGLRGAVAFALVLLIDPKIVPLQPMFMTTTIAVVYFTVFFQGITIKPLVKILNVKTTEKRKPTMNERIHERLMDHAMAAIEDIVDQHGNYHMRDRFKRFDNRFIRPLLLRNHQGAEPKILETYSKLAMRDAMEYMRRNASTIGNISNTESMSAIFRNYTASSTGNLNGRCGNQQNNSKLSNCSSLSQLDSSTWNIDMQELEYNPSKKDLTDAKIHHLLAEELVKPPRRVSHRRLSYSRHAVNDRDLTTQVNYKLHVNMRKMVAEKKHHHSHKRHSKKMNKDGKQNHVSFPEFQHHVNFPEFQQNGTAKQFTHDYINEVLNEDTDDAEPKSRSEEWDSPITFTAKSSPSTGTEENLSVTSRQSAPSVLEPKESSKTTKKPTTVLERSLPWRRGEPMVSDESLYSDPGCGIKRFSRGSFDGTDLMRVITPTATEIMLPWKRDAEEDLAAPLQQNEFPAWASNKEYLAYNSPSATFLGGLENHRSSVIGLFRRESVGSDAAHSTDSTPQRERRGSLSRNTSILYIEDDVDPLGALSSKATQSGYTPSQIIQKSTAGQSSSAGTPSTPFGAISTSQHRFGVTASSTSSACSAPQPIPAPSSNLFSTFAAIPPPPPTPNARRHQMGSARRGSMLELSGSITRDTIPEEPPHATSSLKRPHDWLLHHQNSLNQRRPSFHRQGTLGAALMGNVPSPEDSSSSVPSSDEDGELLKEVSF